MVGWQIEAGGDRRLWGLLRKETIELLRNRQLVGFLTISPILTMVIFGYVLNSDVTHLRLSVLDQNKVAISRELTDAFTVNKVFLPTRHTDSQRQLAAQVQQGKVDAGLVIPPNFNRDLLTTGRAEVQVVIDGINAYASGLAKGYIAQITAAFNRNLVLNKQPVDLVQPAQLKLPQVTYRYNPGLVDSWFFVPGVIGTIMTLSCTLASAVEAVREKDQGTLEQLLMTPVSSTAILISKIVPISLLLTGTLLACFAVAHLTFEIPFRGNFLLFLLISILYIQIGVGMGLTISTLSKNKLQTILIGFFLNIPLILLSDALTAVNSMPAFFRFVTLFNPLYHYLIMVRGILLKGVGLGVLWVHAIALLVFSGSILFLSASQYRKQLT
jgi:ABC-2 type transport system permease protein